MRSLAVLSSLICACIPAPRLRPRDAGAPFDSTSDALQLEDAVSSADQHDAAERDAASSDAASDACNDGDALQVGRCAPVAPARLVWPPHGSRVTSRRPRFQWLLGADADSARVEVCETRSCERAVTSFVASAGTGAPPNDLPSGPLFWRVWARRGGIESAQASATWSFQGASITAATETAQRGSIDVNGDGFADIVVGNTQTHELTVYFGSSGTIGSPVSLQDPVLFAGGFAVLDAGDVNGDGKTDVVVSTSSISWRVYYGSNGGFRSDFASILGTTPASDQRSLLRPVGDLNGDGFSDLAYLLYRQGTWQGSCGLFFGSPSGISNTPSSSLGSTRVLSVGAVGDLDADGYEDLGAIGGAVPSETSPTLFGFAGVPGGVSERLLRGSTIPLAASALLGVRADIDGDGRFDVLIGDDFARPTHAVVLGARGGFAQSLTSRSTQDGSSTRDASLSDLNSDGRADLVMASAAGQQLIVYRGTAAGLTTEVSDRVTLPALLSPPGLISPGDVNGDGAPDLAVLLAESGRILLHLVRGGSTLAIEPRPIDAIVVASSSVLRPIE